jgi:hypothetical protein
MQSFFRLTPTILVIALAPYFTAQPASASKPPAPINVSAVVTSTGILISWSPALGTPAGTTYNIYNGKGTTPPDTTSTDPAVMVGVSLTADKSPFPVSPAPGAFNYVVVAVNGGVSSDASTTTGPETFPVAQTDPNTASDAPASAPPPVPCPQSTSPGSVIVSCNVISNYLSFLPTASGPIDVSSGTINYTQRANLPNLSKLTPTCEKDPVDAVLYNVINLSSGQTVATSRWYLYEPKPGYKKGVPSGWSVVDFNNSTRLYGIRKLEVVSIVLNAATATPTVTYVIQSTKAQPTNVSDFLALLSVVGASPPPPTAGPKLPPPPPPPYYVIGCTTVDTGFSTSSIQVGANIPDKTNSKQLTASQTITNEAKAWWDVSFALPIKKASALQYSSTSNTVTATQLNKESLFATFDLYPFRSDLKAGYSWSPAFFGGVSLASQPLHSILTGVSVHFSMVSVYAGALFIKQQQLSGLAAGASASSAQVSAATSYGFQPSFSVGIKLSIKAGAAQITSSK